MSHTGTVKFFNDAKGYGFIVDDETKEDVFVHLTGLLDDVTKGAKVSYEVAEEKDRRFAVNVRLA